MLGTNMKTIYLAGGCFWGVEQLFRQIPGVLNTRVGYANGTSSSEASYERVCQGDTGFRETVRIDFLPDKLPLERLLWAFFRVVDPSIQNRQGNDIGTQYQSGIYWKPGDEEIEEEVRRVATEKRSSLEASGRPFAVEIKALENFFEAEEYHQGYLIKNPAGYCHISNAEMTEVLGSFKDH